MEGAIMKNKVSMILSAAVIIFFLLWLNAVSGVSKQRTLANDKAVLSMELGEKNIKLEKQRSDLSEELKKAQAALAEEKAQHEETKKILSQEQVAEQALKVELERVTRLKEELEKDLKGSMAGEQKVGSK